MEGITVVSHQRNKRRTPRVLVTVYRWGAMGFAEPVKGLISRQVAAYPYQQEPQTKTVTTETKAFKTQKKHKNYNNIKKSASGLVLAHKTNQMITI